MPRLRDPAALAPLSPSSVRLHTPPLTGTRLVVDDNTTMADVARTFGDRDGKRLRLGQDREGRTILYTKSALIRGTGQLSTKHTGAVNLIKALIDRQVGQQGAGARLVQGYELSAGRGLRDLEGQVGRLAGGLADGRAERRLAERSAARTGYDGHARVAAAAGFRDGRTHLGEANDIRISEDGAGGVVLARQAEADGTSRGVVALKFEHPVRLNGAAFVSSLAEKVAGNVDRPLPFMMPKHERIENPTREDLDHLRTTLQNLPADQQARAAPKVGLLNEHGQVSKYEYLNGHDLDKLPPARKQELYASGKIGADLGRSALLVNALGLSDHLGMSYANGSVNPSNLFVTHEGRLAVMDMAAKNENQAQLGLGLNDQQLTATITSTVDYLERLASSTEPRDQLLDKVMNEGGPPLGPIIAATVSGSEANVLFREGDPAMSRAENRTHVAHLLSGAAESLSYLRDNADAFATAHKEMPSSGIKNPEQTFGQLRDLSARIDAIEAGLNRKLGL